MLLRRTAVFFFTAAVTVVSVFWLHPVGAQPVAQQNASTDSPKDPKKWMEMKLHASQNIFDGLVHGDFKKIETQARRMLVLNILENWVTEQQFQNKTAYEGQLNAFEFAVKELKRNAEAHNLKGTLDAYGLMSKSCVECHALIRDVPQTRQQ